MNGEEEDMHRMWMVYSGSGMIWGGGPFPVIKANRCSGLGVMSGTLIELKTIIVPLYYIPVTSRKSGAI